MKNISQVDRFSRQVERSVIDLYKRPNLLSTASNAGSKARTR